MPANSFSVAQGETFQAPVVWMPFSFPSPERNDGWHQGTGNMPGGQFEMRIQMLQHPSQAPPLNQGDPVLIHSNSASNIATIPHRNVTVANNGGNAAFPQDQGDVISLIHDDAQDPNNYHPDNQDNLESQVQFSMLWNIKLAFRKISFLHHRSMPCKPQNQNY
jgi:hypothetical protein